MSELTMPGAPKTPAGGRTLAGGRTMAGAIALLLALGGLGSCTSARTVQVQGRSLPYEEAAADAFRKAKDGFAAGRFEQAAQSFTEFLETYSDSELADEARLRRGQSLARAGKLTEAQAALEELLEKHPNSKFKRPAALELGLVESKLGKKDDSGASLKPMVAEMSDDEKQKAAQTLSEAYAHSGDAAESARWGAKAVEAAEPGAEREARLADFIARLGQAPAADVARLVAALDRKSPAWPPAALKLARIQLHLGDRAHAGELAAQLLAEQNTGPFAEGAQSIQLSVSGAEQVKPNLIGVVLPLSGELKQFAEPILDAIALRLDLQNRGAVQVSVKDSKSDADGAARAVEELAREGAIAIVGPIGLVEGPAAAVRAQQLGVPMVSLSRAEGLTGLGNDVFRLMLTNSAQARAVAEYAQKKLNARTFGVLQPDSNYGDETVRYFWDALEAGGSEVRAFERYPRQTTTFKPFIAKMVGRQNLAERAEYVEEEKKIAAEITDPYRRRKALAQLKSNAAPIVDFDALFIPDAARTIRLIAPAIAAEDVITSGCDARDLEVIKKTTKRDDLRTVQLLGTNLWNNPDLVDERVGAAKYVQCSIFADGFFAQSQRPATRRFVEDYDSAYHRVPGQLEAHGHDAAGLVKELIEKKHPQTRDQLRDLLAAMDKPFEGAAGDTRFGPEREAQKQLFWLWINRGNIQEFDPEGAPPVPPTAPPAPEDPSKDPNRDPGKDAGKPPATKDAAPAPAKPAAGSKRTPGAGR